MSCSKFSIELKGFKDLNHIGATQQKYFGFFNLLYVIGLKFQLGKLSIMTNWVI